ncbi:formate dehydrogenase accessory sulfurtransferase FdhD [Omnitrophica bacterium]|nr:formate dehydrogenase accessory sulfurtransferase FdhD [Candidatus Omnitrophota bacterium]
MAKINILKIDSEQRKKAEDIVTDEVPLTIHLNGEELLTLLCSPEDLKELCAGLLYSTGLIRSAKEIRNIIIDRQNWTSSIETKAKDLTSKLMFKRLYTPGCGKGILFYNPMDAVHKKKMINGLKIPSGKVLKLMDSFQRSSVSFKETGGVHSAALSEGDNILIFKEDIGRHNALDKVIGEALIKGLNMEGAIALTTGRISSEIISKIERMRAHILISRSAPTDQAVKLAEGLNLTLIGFARGERMNVYTAKERIA